MPSLEEHGSVPQRPEEWILSDSVYDICPQPPIRAQLKFGKIDQMYIMADVIGLCVTCRSITVIHGGAPLLVCQIRPNREIPPCCLASRSSHCAAAERI